MRRMLLIAVLAFGTVAGFASGFAHLHHGRHGGHGHHGHSSCDHGRRSQGSPSPTSP
jgi:hypothetical protein